MPIVAIKELRQHLPPKTRVLGVDHGEKTLGLAMASHDLSIATPFKTLERTKFTQNAQELAKILLRAKDILGFDPVIGFWDERLSTSAMERFLIEQADVSRKRRAEVIDKLAATHILQGALDFMRNN